MIEVSEQKLSQIRYLLTQSMQGNHLLFEPAALRKVFIKDKRRGISLLEADEARHIEEHIERMMSLPSLSKMCQYLDELDSKSYEWVVRTYFHIVESNIAENEEMRH